MRSSLKAIISVVMALVMLLTFVSCGAEEKVTIDEPENEIENEVYGPLSVGDKAPDFEAETVDGLGFKLSEQSDKIVLLNFWATWCSPCVREMPAFERLKEEYGDKLAILAVNCMEDKSTVDKFISDKGYTFPVAYDTDGSIEIKYPTDGIPYTLVIGYDGSISKIYLGAAGADEQYLEYKSAIDSIIEVGD